MFRRFDGGVAEDPTKSRCQVDGGMHPPLFGTRAVRTFERVWVPMSLCACCCSSTNYENPAGTDVLRKGTRESAQWDDLPGHEFRRNVELPKHPLESLSCDRRRRLAADDFIQGRNDWVVGDIHVHTTGVVALAKNKSIKVLRGSQLEPAKRTEPGSRSSSVMMTSATMRPPTGPSRSPDPRTAASRRM